MTLKRLFYLDLPVVCVSISVYFLKKIIHHMMTFLLCCDKEANHHSKHFKKNKQHEFYQSNENQRSPDSTIRK